MSTIQWNDRQVYDTHMTHIHETEKKAAIAEEPKKPEETKKAE